MPPRSSATPRSLWVGGRFPVIWAGPRPTGPGFVTCRVMSEGGGQRGWRLWWAKRRWYERNQRWLRRRQIDRHAARGGFFVRYPVEGELLEALDEGRLRIGEGTLLEP